jgi:hypothetical protein
MIERITFLLAFAAFVLLACDAVLAARRRRVRWLSFATAAVAAVHVALVWAFRYEYSFAQATRNGFGGFLLFHAALVSLLAAPEFPAVSARWLTLFAFVAVCIGASGAVFRYEVVAAYRIPVIVCTVASAVGVIMGMRRGSIEVASR